MIVRQTHGLQCHARRLDQTNCLLWIKTKISPVRRRLRRQGREGLTEIVPRLKRYEREVHLRRGKLRGQRLDQLISGAGPIEQGDQTLIEITTQHTRHLFIQQQHALSRGD